MRLFGFGFLGRTNLEFHFYERLSQMELLSFFIVRRVLFLFTTCGGCATYV